MREPAAVPGAGDLFQGPTADTGREHEYSEGCGSLEEGGMLWDAGQAQGGREPMQEGKVGVLSSPLWAMDSCGHFTSHFI